MLLPSSPPVMGIMVALRYCSGLRNGERMLLGLCRSDRSKGGNGDTGTDVGESLVKDGFPYVIDAVVGGVDSSAMRSAKGKITRVPPVTV